MEMSEKIKPHPADKNTVATESIDSEWFLSTVKKSNLKSFNK